MMSVAIGSSSSSSSSREHLNEEVKRCKVGRRIIASRIRRLNSIWLTVLVLISLSQEGVECLSLPVSGIMLGSSRPVVSMLEARRSGYQYRCRSHREDTALKYSETSEEDDDVPKDDRIRMGSSSRFTVRSNDVSGGRRSIPSAGMINEKVEVPSLTRREAILAASALLAVVSSPSPSSASMSMPTLEDVKLGIGQWTDPKDQTIGGELAMRRANVPPSFATYATRLMIQYDGGVGGWWRGRSDGYSLLSLDEGSSRLGDDFAAMARSVQVAMEGYLNDNDGADASVNVQQRFVELANVFIASYSPSKDNDGEFIRHVALLFTMLPKENQPVQLLKQLAAVTPSPSQTPTDDVSTNINSIDMNTADSLTKLLPTQYQSAFDSVSNAYAITPELPPHQFGLNNLEPETTQPNNITPTIFGPLSSTPLKRQRTIPPSIYALFGFSGALACALTHTLIIPLDVVKTRLQTDPQRYPNVVDGALSIAKTEGIQAFSLGGQATIAGYVWYGATVYPCYTFFKRTIESTLYTEATAMIHINDIALIAGALAAVVASIGLTPMEACRIRTVAEPNKYRDIGLLGTMAIISNENPSVGWRELYAGFPSLLTRQVLFGCIKFLAFERACEAIYQTFPDLTNQNNSAYAALGVTLAAGALSGVLSSVFSQPADSVLTYIAKNSREGVNPNEQQSSIIQSARLMVQNEGVGSLFRGVGSRSLWAACIISGQFFLYDIFRTFLEINSEDLLQVFQVLIPVTAE